MAKQPKLRLVGTHDPASVFDDLDALRQEGGKPATTTLAFQARRRTSSVEKFARVPYERAMRLTRLNGPAWRLLIELDRLIFTSGNRNPVKLTRRSWKIAGLTRSAARHALRQLVEAGVVSVEQQPGQAPWVTHHWFAVM